MAILGTFIDISIVSRAGDGFPGGITFMTAAHSLPATSPEVVNPVLVSVQEVGVNAAVVPVGFGGNASLTTWGVRGSSAITFGTVACRLLAQVFYSTIR